MRYLLTQALVIACVLFFSCPARADRAYRDVQGLASHVRADVDRAESTSTTAGDRHRFDRVREEMNQFQRYGKKHDLNRGIKALQKVVDNNHMTPRDRDLFANDLYQLCEVRSGRRH